MKKYNMLVISNEWLNIKKGYVKYSTYIKYKNIVELHLHPFFNKNECHLSEDCIIEFLTNLDKKDHYSMSTIISIRFVLNSILQFAEKKYDYPHIHFEFIKLPSYKNTVMMLTNKQKLYLEDYCLQNINASSISILLGLYAGLRIGEICALQWQDIDLEQCIITISKTVQRLKNSDNALKKTSLMILKPKTTSSYRQVPIPLFLKNYLNKYKKEDDEDAYILSHSNKVIDPRTIQYRFHKICKQNNFQINFHSLRHTYATNCVEVGVEIKSLSEILGHSKVSTTLERYVHSSIKFKQEQIRKMKAPHFS